MAHVEVVYSAAPRQVDLVTLAMPPACTVRDALIASGLLERYGLLIDAVRCGVWGRRCDLAHVLRDGDRVEIYRGLTVDPKEARRLRYKGQPKKKRPAAPGV
jgi:putative ubiquitin-RnfH superfamily antitoxin RatB of RatAB toxin-antitoxin module